MRQENPLVDTEPLHASPAHRRLAFYLLLLALPALTGYLLPVALLRLPSFESWGGTIYGPALDFGFRAANRNADVVLFGDSSVLYGVNPSLIARETGLNVINLPNTVGSLPVTGDMVLARYLKTNRPPRLIVLYFSPWDLDYHNRHSTQTFEGEEMLFRNGTLSEVWSFARRHPSETLLFPIQFYSVAPKVAFMARLRHQDRVAGIRATMGHIDAQSFRAHIAGPCTIAPSLMAPTGFESVQLLARRYTTQQTRVLIVVAPIPACSNAAEVIARPWTALPSRPPQVLDRTLFLDDGFYTHLDPAAVPAVSQTLAQAIQSALQ